jgi:hypothetical protein
VVFCCARCKYPHQSTEVGAHRKPGNGANLLPVVHPAVFLAPCRLLGLADKVSPGEIVVVPDFSAAHPAGKFLRTTHVDAGTIL